MRISKKKNTFIFFETTKFSTKILHNERNKTIMISIWIKLQLCRFICRKKMERNQQISNDNHLTINGLND